MAKKSTFSFGDVADWPVGSFDDFDGEIVFAIYEPGDYGCQLFMVIRPESYEFEARSMEEPEDEYDYEEAQTGVAMDGYIPGWYSMGDNADNPRYDLSDDYDQALGPPPSQRTQLGRLVMSLVTECGMKFKGSAASQLVGVKAHWKGEKPSRNSTREKLFPTGKVAGTAKVAEPKGRKARRSSQDEEVEEAPKKRPARRRIQREEKVEEQEVEEVEEVEEDETPEFESGADLLIFAIGEAGDDGLPRRGIARALAKYRGSAGAKVVAEAAKRATITEVLEGGEVEEVDGSLVLA